MISLMNVVTRHIVYWYLYKEREKEREKERQERPGCNVSLLNAGNELLAAESRALNCPDLETSNLTPSTVSHRDPVPLIRL